jgi:hypothetical protein
MPSARSTPSVTMPPRVCQGYGSPQWPRSAISMHNGMPYRSASETMPLIAARNPWFCIRRMWRSPAKYAPAATPIASSSFATWISVMCGSRSACCSSSPSHVSGSADSEVMPASLMLWKTTFEFSYETDIVDGL